MEKEQGMNHGIEKERAILVGLQVTGGRTRKSAITLQEAMAELRLLAEAAGAWVLASIVQNRPTRDATYYLGKGKLEEIKGEVLLQEATVVIFNGELSGSQLRNIEEMLACKVLDRTALILDIFAQRALSKEGKLQVELAQLKYRLPRLQGMGKEMSRTGGGIGTRGPGEQKLETDRRHIMSRVTDIKWELEEVKKTRMVQRSQRLKSQLPLVALVGYTNAGKSSLLNALIRTHSEYDPQKEVLAKDMLFASLEVTLRKAALPSKKEYLVVDTVGFVSHLPHDLVEAFKATLEEVKYADLILHVIDASNENHEMQMNTTLDVLRELGVHEKQMLHVYNKTDLIPGDQVPRAGEDQVHLSVATGKNLDRLLDLMEKNLYQKTHTVRLQIPFDQGNVSSRILKEHQARVVQYLDQGVLLEVTLDQAGWERYSPYRIHSEEADNPSV